MKHAIKVGDRLVRCAFGVHYGISPKDVVTVQEVDISRGMFSTVEGTSPGELVHYFASYKTED